MNPIPKKVFIVEGNIGAGKSTLIEKIGKITPNSMVLAEPVNEWKNIENGDLLQLFYSNPQRWAYTFELESMVSKVRALGKALISEKTNIFMERSLFSDQVFQKINHENGNISLGDFLKIKDEFVKEAFGEGVSLGANLE